MEAQESNLICDIQKSIRYYNNAVSEYNELKKRENLINPEIMCNLKELEIEIRYLRFHLRYLEFKRRKFNEKEIKEAIENLNPIENKKNKRRKK